MEQPRIVFIGRLELDTGLLDFLNWLKSKKKYHVDFCGDGAFSGLCKKYGKVHGFVNPLPYLKKADIVVPGGYLSYIEAKKYKCKIMTFPTNPLKVDYWDEIKKVKKFQPWDNISYEYLDLYNSSK